MQHWTHTHAGLRRDHNEDAFLVESALGLFGVADGIGGYAGGEVASAEAVRVIARQLHRQRGRIERLGDPDDMVNREQLTLALRLAVKAANCAIRRLSGREGRDERMGTTFCGGIISGRQALIANVGDSRAYLLRDGALSQLTADHTVTAEQVRLGLLTQKEADASELRHMLRQALGASRRVEPDIVSVTLQAGDRLLFCSDGVHDQIAHETLAGIMADADGNRAVERLIEAANQAGGVDNATAVLVAIPASADRQPGRDVAASRPTLRDLPLFCKLDQGELGRLIAVAERRRSDGSGSPPRAAAES